ncbi:MAG TPA: hypothetical protein VML35_08505 [Gaiellaceae bacterium]|nr:hypothetical protein [Gaiellaceae bacterium]
MTKLLLGLGGAGLAALGTVLAVALAGGGSTVPTVGTLTAPTGDISGPCDELEHRDDPRCAGVAGTATVRTTTTTGRDRREPGEDVRGPCDEVEHADDPRCTGAVTTDDRRGRGRGGDDDDRRGRGRGGDDDRSGSNSGRG